MSEQFGGYSLGQRLGSGDMGTVYKALPPGGGDPVALKILDHVDTSDRMKRGAAVELLEFVTTLAHPRLHPLSAVVETEDGRLGLVMPLSPIGSVGDLLWKGAAIPPKQGFKLLGQVASALQYLHDQEVAHGSVKPSNILLTPEGDATLTDLSMVHLRELGFIPAKPSKQHMLFMPPEREYHAPPEVVGDVYSLSVLAYLLLTGKMPFSEPEPEARGVVPPLNLPPAVAAVLRRAMNPHLRLRYHALMEFMSALKDATQGRIDPETEKVFGVSSSPPPDAQG